MAADITAIILTKNEEVNIEECIKSIITTVKRIVVIDSFSTDKTVEIAKRMGAEVYQHPFENYAKQYMYGVEVAKAETVWTLRIDADERLTPDSANELTQLCDSNMKNDVTGIVLRFKKNFLGKDLYHGGVYPWKKMNCYKTKFGEIEDRNMDVLPCDIWHKSSGSSLDSSYVLTLEKIVRLYSKDYKYINTTVKQWKTTGLISSLYRKYYFFKQFVKRRI